MARLIPGGDGGCGGACASKVPLAEEEEGGCGSSNGRIVGGDMEKMEKRLAQNDQAPHDNLETEITTPKIKTPKQRGDAVPLANKKLRKGLTPKKKQVMGQCSKCGYLSSQEVCKACVLLEGLNKARPKNGIDVGYEVQDLQQRDQGDDGVGDAMQRTSIGGD